MHVSLPYTDNPQIRSNSTQFHPDPGYPVSRSFPYRVANIRRVTDRFPGRPVQGGRMRINRGQIHFLPEPRTAAPFLNGLTPAPVNRCLVTSFDPNTTRNPADAPTPTTDATPNRVTVPRPCLDPTQRRYFPLHRVIAFSPSRRWRQSAKIQRIESETSLVSLRREIRSLTNIALFSLPRCGGIINFAGKYVPKYETIA